MKNLLYACFVLFFLFFSLSNVHSQNLVGFGINLNPKVSFFINEQPNLSESEYQMSFSGGLDLFYDISDRLQLKSGVNYSLIILNQVDYTLTYGSDLDPSTFEVDYFASSIRNEINIHYISIPIALKYKLAGEENHLYTKVGFEVFARLFHKDWFYLMESGSSEIEVSENASVDVHNAIVKANLGFGYEFQLTSKAKLSIEPLLEYSLTDIFENVNSGNNLKTIEAGVMVGIRF